MSLRKVWYFVLCCCVIGAYAVPLAQAEESASGLGASLDFAYNSKYIWRGTVPNDESVLQPSLTLSLPKGLSFNWWGNMDLTNFADERGNFTEIDYTLSYGWSSGALKMNAGLISYTFPELADTAEAFISASSSGILSPTLSLYYDFDEAEGFYASLSASHSLALANDSEKPLNLGLSAKVGFGSSDYNKFYFGADDSALVDLTLSASMPISVGETLTITPSINYSMLLDNDIEKAYEAASGLDSNNFWFGVNFSIPL